MGVRKTLAVLAMGALLSGCANLKNSIHQRVEISEECRAVTATPPVRWSEIGQIANFQMGNVGTCDIRDNGSVLAVCSLNQIRTRYNLKPPQQASSVLQSKLEGLDGRVANLKGELNALSILAGGLDGDYKAAMDKLRRPQTRTTTGGSQAQPATAQGNYADVTDELKKTDEKHRNIADQIDKVRSSLEALRTAMKALNEDLPNQARIELAAWDSNLRVQLTQLEQMASGDYSLILRAGLKDQVLTHVGRRSLELLHGALKPADAVLARLDEKAYGTVSVGYLVFGPNIQSAVNDAFEKVKESYRARLVASGESPAQDSGLEPFMKELRRAACDNLVQGTQFSMLSELVDTMLILQVSKHYPVLEKNAASASVLDFLAIGEKVGMLASRTAPLSWTADDGFIAMDAALSMDGDAVATPATPLPAAIRAVTPFAVYATNEWTARQQLLVQKLTAKYGADTTKDKDKTPDFPEIDVVEETSVRQLAEATTAKTVDDATRLDPGMLKKDALTTAYLKNQVNVVTAASAVNQVAISMQVNLSVSNTNTFTPTNTNHNAPVINVSVPTAASEPPDLCASIGADIACTNDSGGYLISFDPRSFKSDSCSATDMEPALSRLGQHLAAYRARHGVGYDALVQGYASLPKTQLAGCSAARQRNTACHYVNQLGNQIVIEACKNEVDLNRVLSAARAGRAARVLERAGKGSVVVTALTAEGTSIALKRGIDALPASDQTIMIRLTRRPAR